MLSLGITVLGLVSASRLPVDLLPNIAILKEQFQLEFLQAIVDSNRAKEAEMESKRKQLVND